MRILITGAGGFIGSFLTEHFLKKGEEVIAICHTAIPRFAYNFSKKLKIIKLQLSQELPVIEPVDAVIHAAAVHPNSRRVPKIKDYFESNLQGTFNVANHAKKSKAKYFVYLSSVTVHGNVLTGILTESSPLNQPDMYGITKYAGELILKDYSDKFSSLCIRLPGVVGPGYFTPWLGKVLHKALNNEAISIYNSDSLFNNVVDLSMLGKFISLLLNSGYAGFDVVNLAASGPITIREAVDKIVSILGSQSQIVEVEGSKQSFLIDINKLKERFGFVPDATASIIERYVAESVKR